VSHKFTKDERVRKRNDFIRVYSKGRRFVCPEFIGFYYRREEKQDDAPEEYTRLGMSVGRKAGNSVVRSKIKRRIREVFRLNKHLLNKGYDIIIHPRQIYTFSVFEKAMLDFFSSAGLMEKPVENKN
jgi:ribonuclease P protein component